MTDDQRDHYNNLIYMCGDHHTQIDKQEEDFLVDKLFKIKLAHEQKVREALNAAFADIGFRNWLRLLLGFRGINRKPLQISFLLYPLKKRSKRIN